MLGNLSGWHLVVLIAIVLLLFGAPRLPRLARSVGESMRIFRREVKTLADESGADSEAATATTIDGAPASRSAASAEETSVLAPARTE